MTCNIKQTAFATHFYHTSIKDASPATSWHLITKADGTISLEKKQARLWRVLGQIQKTSYNIEQNTEKLLKQLKESLQHSKTASGESSDAYKSELVCAIKCCLFIKDLLKNAKKNPSRRAIRQKLQNTFKTRSYQYLESLSRLEGCSSAQSAAKHKITTMAVSILSKNPLLDDVTSNLNELLHIAYTKKNFGLCLALVQKGASPLKDSVDRLLEHAIETKNTDAARILIDKKPDLFFKSSIDLRSFLHLACQKQLYEVVVHLVQKGAFINSQDKYVHTPLHIACENLNPKIALFLIQNGANFCKKNESGNTALQVHVNGISSDSVNQFYITLFDQIPFVKEKITSRGVAHFIEFCSNDPATFLKQCPSGIALEIAFLLQNTQMANAIAKSCTKQDFAKHVAVVKKKYPECPLDLLYFCCIEIIPEHITAPFTEKRIDMPPEPIDLNVLLILFDQIVDVEPKAKCLQRKKIEEFIRRIKKQVVFDGVPQKEAERAIFYKTIENAVKNVLLLFKTLPDSQDIRAKKRRFLKEILDAALLCGGRYFSSMTAAYRLYCKGQVATIEDDILLLLAEYRELLTYSLVDSLDKDNVRVYNYILRMYGDALGLPGKETMKTYVDPSHKVVSEQEVKRHFFELYTPENIQNEWLLPHLQTNEALRARFIDWHKTHIPSHWKKDAHDYLKSEVFEKDGTIKKEAITYLLCNMPPSIFSCTHRIHALTSFVHRLCA